ncbi:MAG TPA: hypothetical protein VN764_02255 [Polyangiaceae bacterium]|nr:hypothetical protein [Polyangiaceae bacterium]
MTKYDDRRANTFLVLWTLAVIATTCSFLVYLAVRVETMQHGYELGRAYGDLARLREAERVLELERASLNTPERIDLIGRTLFFMEEPDVSRVMDAGPDPSVGRDVAQDAVAQAESEDEL